MANDPVTRLPGVSIHPGDTIEGGSRPDWSQPPWREQGGGTGGVNGGGTDANTGSTPGDASNVGAGAGTTDPNEIANLISDFPDPQAGFQQLMDQMLRRGMAGPRANPYNQGMADATRGPQQALYAQMLQQAQGGPSVSGMQGGIASGQSMQAQAAAMGGRGGALGGGAALMQGAGVNAGLAGQTGQNRLAEAGQQASQSMQGTSGLRGRDIQSAVAQSNAGLQQRSLDDANTRFYLSQGMDLASAQRQSALEGYKFHRRLANQIKAKQDQTASDILGVTGGILSLFTGGGAGPLSSSVQGATTSGDHTNGG